MGLKIYLSYIFFIFFKTSENTEFIKIYGIVLGFKRFFGMQRYI